MNTISWEMATLPSCSTMEDTEAQQRRRVGGGVALRCSQAGVVPKKMATIVIRQRSMYRN